jgi:hypothetical protein
VSRTNSIISQASLLSGILIPARSIFIVRSTFIARLLLIDLERKLREAFSDTAPVDQHIVHSTSICRAARIPLIGTFPVAAEPARRANAADPPCRADEAAGQAKTTNSAKAAKVFDTRKSLCVPKPYPRVMT